MKQCEVYEQAIEDIYNLYLSENNIYEKRNRTFNDL